MLKSECELQQHHHDFGSRAEIETFFILGPISTLLDIPFWVSEILGLQN